MKIVIFIALFVAVCISNGAQVRAFPQLSTSVTTNNVNNIETDAHRLVLSDVKTDKEYVTQATKVEMPTTQRSDNGLGLTTVSALVGQKVGSSIDSKEQIDGNKAGVKSITAENTELPRVQEQFGIHPGTSYEEKATKVEMPATQRSDNGLGLTTVSALVGQKVGSSIDSKEQSDGDKAGEKTNTAENSELPRVQEQFGIHPGTSYEEKELYDTRLYKTYGVDSMPSHLNIIKEDTIIHDHVNRLPSNSKIRIRRKRRNIDSSDSSRNGRQQYSAQSGECDEKGTKSFYFAIIGWSLFVIQNVLLIVVKCNIVTNYRDYKRWRREVRGQDVEAQDARMRYHLKGKLPTMDVINEDEYIPDPPPPMENRNVVWLSNRELQHNKHVAERRKIIQNVTFADESCGLSNGIIYAKSVIVGGSDRERMDRKSAQKRSVIKGHASDMRRPSLVEEIQFAKSVILHENEDLVHDKKMHENRKLIERRSSDSTALSEDLLKYAAHVLVKSEEEKQCSRRASENRRVIKEATCNERRGSLLEEVTFARSVILPPNDHRELDEDAQLRRRLIKSRHESSGRRLSLQDDLLIAKKVIIPEQQVNEDWWP